MKKISKLLNSVPFIVWMILVVFIGAFAGKFITDHFVQRVTVSGSSMYPTYEDGDNLLMDKIGNPKRGDVIVIAEEDLYLIKRVVGMPGDDIKIENGSVFINNIILKEPYLPNNIITDFSGIAEDTIHLNKDEYFVLGDNRMNSRDSRYFGAVSSEDILGIVSIKLW